MGAFGLASAWSQRTEFHALLPAVRFRWDKREIICVVPSDASTQATLKVSRTWKTSGVVIARRMGV